MITRPPVDVFAIRNIAAGVEEGAADPEARERVAAAREAVARQRSWIQKLGTVGESALLRWFDQQNVPAADLNRMPSIGKARNFPGLDIVFRDGFASVKVKKGNDSTRSYAADLRSLLNHQNSARAAAALLDERNTPMLEELRQRGAWPRDLPADPAEVATFIRNVAQLRIPDDHVPKVQKYLRWDIQRFPENYGLPEGRMPSRAQIDNLVCRVGQCGISSTDIDRLVPTPAMITARVAETDTTPPAPGEAGTIHGVIDLRTIAAARGDREVRRVISSWRLGSGAGRRQAAQRRRARDELEPDDRVGVT